MKRHTINSLFAFGTIACSLAACSQDEAELDNPIENLQTYTLYLDADVPTFDSESEGETRALGNSWEDGDVIYISYSNFGSKVVSKATYKSSMGAFQMAASSLSEASDEACSVFYFRGGTISEEGSNSNINMDKFTAIFSDTNAKYTCINNAIYLYAALKPYTWRLCLKGEVGTHVKLLPSYSIQFNRSLELISGGFTTRRTSEELVVQSSGYTPFIHGLFIGSSNLLQVEVGGTIFYRTLESEKLAVGESGYLVIPTESNLHGWTKGIPYGTINGHEFVDLGLPSGTLWATCNVGASSPDEIGGCFAWGETEEKDFSSGDWSTYIHCGGTRETCYFIGNDISGTEYDVAHVRWRETWCMPSRDHLKELTNYCTMICTSLNGEKIILVTGPNGGAFFLNGITWSSTLYPYDDCGAYGLIIDEYHWDCSEAFFRYAPFPIRPIIPGDRPIEPDSPVAQAIDLGLPSGTKWASWNLGASAPEEYGDYYAWGETEEKEVYNWITYKWCNGSSDTMTKYCTRSKYGDNGFTDGLTELLPEDDAATANWGAPWHMPTEDQIKELKDNCTRMWTQLNGVNGMLVTGPNGNSIFLPATGRRSGNQIQNEGVFGYYWLSSLRSSYDAYADIFYITKALWTVDYGESRFMGQSVRAVCP